MHPSYDRSSGLHRDNSFSSDDGSLCSRTANITTHSVKLHRNSSLNLNDIVASDLQAELCSSRTNLPQLQFLFQRSSRISLLSILSASSAITTFEAPLNAHLQSASNSASLLYSAFESVSSAYTAVEYYGSLLLPSLKPTCRSPWYPSQLSTSFTSSLTSAVASALS